MILFSSDKDVQKIQEASLRLFGNVVCQDTIKTLVCGFKRNNHVVSEKEKELFQKYKVVIHPRATAAIDCIYAHVTRTKLSVQQLNATFYRSWNDVLGKTRLELLIDQLLHYYFGDIPASETGLDVESLEKQMKTTVITAISGSDACEKCLGLLKSGTALHLNTIKDAYIIVRGLGVTPLAILESTKNREARAYITGQNLSNRALVDTLSPLEFFGALIYSVTESTLIIKDKTLLRTIAASGKDVAALIRTYNMEALSSIFQRFKPIFIAFKLAHKANKPVINHLSRLSKRHHKPMSTNPLNCVTFRPLQVDLRGDQQGDNVWLDKATVPALLRAINACHLALHEQTGFRYLIRNGKTWLSDKTRTEESRRVAKINKEILVEHLVRRVGHKFRGKRVYIPKEVAYGLPISEKQMLGNLPYYTKVTLPASEGMAVGIYWKKEYACQDLDLSARTLDGRSVSWNSEYAAGSIFYSGDMTFCTEHGATEYLLMRGSSEKSSSCQGLEAMFVSVNKYCGDNEYEYDVIVASGKSNIDRKYMMNPSNLLASFHNKSSRAQNSIGYVTKTEKDIAFILVPGSSANSAVSSTQPGELKEISRRSSEHLLKYSLTLNDVLQLLDAEIVRSIDDPEVDLDLSLDKINRDFYNLLLTNDDELKTV